MTPEGEPASRSLRHLQLAAEHERLGAHFGEFAGWWLPIHYGSDRAEHLATRSASGLFDLSHMAEITVEGRDATMALDRVLTADVAALAVGRARYCFYCNEHGGVIDDLVVYRLGPQRLLVVANAANRDAVAEGVQSAGVDLDTEVHDDSERYVLLALQGPLAAEVVAELTDAGTSLPRRYSVAEMRIGGSAVLVSRTGYTGEDGFELFVDPGDALELYRSIREHGGPRVVPAGLAARDSLRLEAGLPLHGHELGPDISPYDAGLGRFVALDKSAEFCGEEALAERHSHRGPRTLVGLRARSGRSPRTENPVLDGSGAQVGTITSGAPSPSLGVPIAMGYIDVAKAAIGTSLLVEVRGAEVPVEVVELPFYIRDDATRPRRRDSAERAD